MRSAALSVADLVLPRVCVVCGRTLLLGERHICTVCEADLPRTYFASLRDNPMARAFNEMLQREMPATQPYGYAAALLYYREDSPYKNIPMDLKYHRNFGEGRYFARMLGRELAASPLFADVDAVVPVPLHWLRLWRRGYNQAEVIARAVAEGFAERGIAGVANGFCAGTPAGLVGKTHPICRRNEEKCPSRRQNTPDLPTIWTDVLRRVRRTRTQTRLDHDWRYTNVRSAFVADARRLAFRLTETDLDVPAVQSESGVTCRIKKGSGSASPARIRHLLLVDDTFTTGSTLCACERTLRSALSEVLGPAAASRIRISVATLSYVGK